ncbi:unnamed protein product [Lymnaea stagnalis]|uniref:Cadherin domain-containing protein n=1 Tax=Lymnaea stagnalis TaxID=6523 RepID=A0AAV2HLX2_LYMST
MEGNHVTVVLLVACYCFSIHQSQVCGATPPVLTLADIDVELNEQEDKVLDLNGDKPIATCEDGDNDLTRAYIQSVSPSAPCGSKCFMLLPCGAANGTDYCLSFVPTEGTLNYVRASSYTLTVACTDDTDGVSTKTLTVTIKSNTPPSFDPVPPATVTIDGTSVKAGDIVYDVNTKDVDGDPVYYTMLTSPSTSYLSIGYTDGEIRATNDLKYLCESKVTATVRAFDSYNPAIGPKTIEFIVNPYNTAPVIKNLDTTLQVKENTGAGSVIHVLDIVDANVPYKNIRMTSVTSAGLEQYKLNGKNLELNIKPNYERTDTRSVVLYFDVTDGYCSSPQYSLTVNIVDVPEPPVLTPPKRKQIDVYEGDVSSHVVDIDKVGFKINFDTMIPVDIDKVGFKINFDTMIPVDIDKKNPSKSFDIDYTVTDNYGEKAKGSLTIVVHDINDNAPLFTSKSYSFTATECTAVASKLGQVAAVDDDSPYQSNDALVYGGGGDKMAVTSTGDVVLVQPCIDGETDSAVASVTDLGEYPGPLQGPSVSITMTCGPCPPTVPPKTTTTTATTTTTTTTKKPSTTVTVVRSSGVDDMEHVMSWLIPALIGGAVFLALTAYMIYRYCIPCRSSCAGKCSQKAGEIKKTEESNTIGSDSPTPTSSAPSGLTTRTTQTRVSTTFGFESNDLLFLHTVHPPNPYLFGFWKEQYTDQDHLTQPARAAKPLPIENMPSEDVVPRGNAPPPDYLKLGNPGPGQFNKPSPVNNNNKNVPAASQAESKKSNCIIL